MPDEATMTISITNNGSTEPVIQTYDAEGAPMEIKLAPGGTTVISSTQDCMVTVGEAVAVVAGGVTYELPDGTTTQVLAGQVPGALVGNFPDLPQPPEPTPPASDAAEAPPADPPPAA